MADSVASEPPETKNTRFRSPGVRAAMALGQVDLGFGEEARVGEGDLAGLGLHGLGDLGHPVADADHMDPGAGVEPGAAVVAVEPAALAAGDAQPAVLADPVEEAVAGHR